MVCSAGYGHAATCRMTTRIFSVAAIFTLFVGSITASDAAEFLGLAKRVIDGDDIEVCADGGPCRDVRLCGIDAPEVECGRSYNEAREALRALVEGKHWLLGLASNDSACAPECLPPPATLLQ